MIKAIVWALAISGIAFSQIATDSKLQFEVASARIAPPDPRPRISVAGGPGTSDPERMVFKFCPLKYLLLYAYAPTFDRATYTDDPIVTGPAWLVNGPKYEIVAKVPAGSTKEQARVMLQNLLVDRFKLVIRKESKEVAGYELSVAKGGSKLTESEDPNAPPNSAPLKLDRDQFPVVPEGTTGLWQVAGYVAARNQSIEDLRKFVAVKLGTHPSMILDQTGLTHTYDFKFRTVAGGPQFPGVPSREDIDGGPSIFEALEKQLGLKLEGKKVVVDRFVVESAERTPVEN